MTEERQFGYNCPPVAPQYLTVQQVVGEGEEQKTINIHVVIPRGKPPIEQVIEAFVRDLAIHAVNVACNKVVVRGSFEVKAIYVACRPDQPVHAAEVRRVRFTSDVCIPGANPGMDADASVTVEYVDYDCDTRYEGDEEEAEDYCAECLAEDGDDLERRKKCYHPYEPECFRCFDVTVVLAVTVKVVTDRQIWLQPGQIAPPKG